MRRLTLSISVLALVVAACTQAADQTTTTAAGGQPSGQGLLATVQDRGTLLCGVNDAVPGFGFRNPDGTFSGFDIDYCKAVAAAVLGDADAVEYVPLTAQQRFTALQSGEIDVLIRNTTWTASRDGGEGATFLHTTFYDGQGMMVRADSGITTIEELEGSAICVLSGTTTELNLATRMAGIDYTPLTFEDNETLQSAFVAGQCEGWTSDKSQLAGVRSNFPEAEGGPESLVILEETFSKEPLGPVVRDGDSQWAQVVDWVVLATIQAEEFGITSQNIDTFADTDDNAIRRFLGLEITDDEGNTTVFDPGLGLPTDFASRVIRAVGNYAEIYDRNVGPNTPLGLERGLNALWTDGGLLYAPPYR
ncbi:MAG: amino acid ABC transporter substrate-binding protein [Acidimicrobiia bacterium]|jgi:general L-amino acid transport system substrate-binding protein|nr:MAG: amino acid ABC transporter substrate-binding protein [Acidimicrobiia bacterium]